LSGLLPPSPASPGSGCPQLRRPAATRTAVKVSHLHSNHNASRRTPDLLQTPDYATAACKAAQPRPNPSQIARLVAVSQRRQRRLLDGGCQVHLILDQSALVRAVARPDVMTGQLQQVLDLAARPTMTVQVVAMEAPQAVLSLPFRVLGFPDTADGDVVAFGGDGGPVTVSRRAADAREAVDTFSALARSALNPADSAVLIAGLVKAT
jgi:hypothetical protein